MGPPNYKKEVLQLLGGAASAPFRLMMAPIPAKNAIHRDRFFHFGSFLPPMLWRSTASYRRPSGSDVGND
jgi:hypothetical protein